jgi:hypothetical protein
MIGVVWGSAAVVLLRGVVDETPGGGVDVTVDPAAGVAGGAGTAFLTTLLVGAVLIALAPAYTDRQMETVFDEPLGSFLWGLVGIGGVILFAILLVLSLIGILFVIPFLIVAYLAWAVGSTIAFIAIDDRLAEAFDLGDDDGRTSDRERRDRDRREDDYGDRQDDRDGGVDAAAPTDREGDRGWLWPLVIGALLNGGLVASGVGGLVALAIGMVGFGALLTDRLG